MATPPIYASGSLFAPVTTPFSASTGDLDLDAFERNLNAHLAAGINGIVVAGSTGEAALLDEDERSRLAQRARRTVAPGVPLVIGVGGESTRITLRRARAAGERGADIVIVVAPHYYGPNMTEAALRGHYLRVADDSPVPVLLYNIPKYAHFTLSAALVGELALHGNVCGIKDSSGELAVIRGYLAFQSSSFSVLTGNAGTFAEALGLGARGGILAAALFMPALATEILAASRAGDADRARTAQARLTPLGTEIVGKMGVAGVKAALDAVGLAGGDVRAPLLGLGTRERDRVRELMALAAEPSTAGSAAQIAK
ncbi:MAG: 4-hydroxy-tetrahydrodipicolinate synthase [Gemmatimonadaceae bacterium]